MDGGRDGCGRAGGGGLDGASAAYSRTSGSGPGGEKWRLVVRTVKEGTGRRTEYQFDLRRTDGSTTIAELVGGPTDGRLPLTGEQLRKVVMDPAVVLPPAGTK